MWWVDDIVFKYYHNICDIYCISNIQLVGIPQILGLTSREYTVAVINSTVTFDIRCK